ERVVQSALAVDSDGFITLVIAAARKAIDALLRAAVAERCCQGGQYLLPLLRRRSLVAADNCQHAGSAQGDDGAVGLQALQQRRQNVAADAVEPADRSQRCFLNV